MVAEYNDANAGLRCLLCSNLRIIPCAHPIYDVCWKTLLPMSLAAVIIGSPIYADKDGKQHSY